MKNKIFVSVLIIGGLLLAGESYYFNGQYVGKYLGLGDVVERDYSALKKAKTFESEGDIATANDLYSDLIKTTEDDIVLERSIREYGRNLSKSDALAGLQKDIELASNPRIRASARAGAVENLARVYTYQTTIDTDTLTKEIFANSPFKELKARTDSEVPEYVVLLEYANLLSPRPVVTAMLAEHYAREIYKGNQRIQEDLEEMLSLLDTLIPEIPEGSPNIPVALTYETSALLYASAAEKYYDGRYADQLFSQAIESAQGIVDQVMSIFESDAQVDEESLIKSLKQSYFSPMAQFSVIFKTLSDIPKTNQAEAVFDEYKKNTSGQKEIPSSVTVLLQTLSETYPTAQTLLKNQ